MAYDPDDTVCWLNAFEAEIGELLSRWYSRWEFNTVSPIDARYRFAYDHGNMREAMWTIAHFSHGHRFLFTVEQSAALWFNECCLPLLKKDQQAKQDKDT